MSSTKLKRLVPLYGSWKFADNGSTATCLGSGPNERGNHSLALLDNSLKDGIVECKIRVRGWADHACVMIVFRANGQERYLAAGLGGWDFAYSALEGAKFFHTQLAGVGEWSNVVNNCDYSIRVAF